MGIGPFKTFITKIAPTLGRSSGAVNNHALYIFVRRCFGVAEDAPTPPTMLLVFCTVQIAVLLLILTLIFIRRQSYWQHPAHVFAAGLALISWLLIFSPIFWEHYQAYLAPFWGWLAYQAARCA